MEKRGVWILALAVFAVIMSANALASEQISPGKILLFNGTLYDGQIVEIEGKNIDADINPSFQVVVQHDGNTIISQAYKCVSKDEYKYCIYNVSEDEYGNLFAEVEVVLHTAFLQVERSFDRTEAYAGELMETDVTLTNIGYQPADSINYADEFPYYVQIYSSQEMAFSKNKTFWTGSINPGNSKSFKYVFYSKNSSEFDQSSNITFFNGYNTTYSNSSEESFSFNHSVTKKVSATSLDIGEESSLNITIYNPYTDNTRIEEGIYFSSGLTPESYNGCQKEENKLSCIAILDRNEERVFSVKFRASKSEKQNISFVVEDIDIPDPDIRIKNLFDEDTDIVSITNSLDDMEIVSSASASDQLKENTKKQISVGLSNPNLYAALTNIAFKAEFNNQTINGSVPYIGADDETQISFELAMPEVSKTSSKPLKLSTNYTTEFGERDYVEKTISLSVQDDSGIEITKTFSNTSFNGNETLNITVKLKNNRGVDLPRILAEETYPSDFKLLKGLAKKYLPMDSGESLTAYSYLLKVPSPDYDTEYTFVTTVKDDFGSKLTTYTSQGTVSVKGRLGKRPPVQLNNSVNSSSSNTSVQEMENLINDETGKNNYSEQQAGGDETTDDSQQGVSKKNGGVLMLVIFYLPLAVLILLIIVFFVFVKMKFIILNLPKIIIQPRKRTVPGQQPEQQQMPEPTQQQAPQEQPLPENAQEQAPQQETPPVQQAEPSQQQATPQPEGQTTQGQAQAEPAQQQPAPQPETPQPTQPAPAENTPAPSSEPPKPPEKQ